MTNQEMILECLMSALLEIKGDFPEFMQSDEMFDYLRTYLKDSWKSKIEESLRDSRSRGRQLSKEEWKLIMDHVKQTIPLKYDANLTKVSVKFGHKFLAELNNKQNGI